ncbi:MAG: protein jag [Bdellovibrio sp.]|jgi:spoIIIJ-associated protein
MNFFKKLFGGKSATGSATETLVRETLEGLIEKGGFDLEFDLNSTTDDKGEPQILVELRGGDEEMLKENEGEMIESLQLFLKRVLQHHLPEDRTNVVIDSNGYREESSNALVELAEKLKGVALEKGKPVYFRALSPKDRKVIHQYLANDQRVKSRSIGEGLFKKIKIFPVKGHAGADDASADAE